MRWIFLLLTRAINRWQQKAERDKAKWKRSAPHERRSLLEKQGEREGSIWQSRSQPFVICLGLGIIALLNPLCSLERQSFFLQSDQALFDG